MQDSGVPYDRFVSLESASNSCPSNLRLPRLVVPAGRPALPDEHDLPGQPALRLFLSAGRRLRLHPRRRRAGTDLRHLERAAVHAAGLARRRRERHRQPGPRRLSQRLRLGAAGPQLLLPRPDRRIPGIGPPPAGHPAGLVLAAVGHEHRLADAGAQRRRHAEVLAGAVQPPVPPGRYFLLPLGFGRPGVVLAGGLGPLLAG